MNIYAGMCWGFRSFGETYARLPQPITRGTVQSVSLFIYLVLFFHTEWMENTSSTAKKNNLNPILTQQLAGPMRRRSQVPESRLIRGVNEKFFQGRSCGREQTVLELQVHGSERIFSWRFIYKLRLMSQPASWKTPIILSDIPTTV